MDLTQLEVGMEFKNYKTLCMFLEEKIKTGEAKIKQLQSWNLYFSFFKKGNSFIIEEIYEAPKIKESKRFGIVTEIEILLLDLLKNEQTGTVLLSKAGLFKVLNMVNGNYNLGRYHPVKLGDYLSVSLEEVKEFYELSSDSINRRIISALNNLSDKSILFWTHARTVCVIHLINEKNSVGKNAVHKNTYIDENEEEKYNFSFKGSIYREHRKATEDEILMIMNEERKIMDDMGCGGKQDVVKRGLWKEFSRRVNNNLVSKMNILYYYDSYEIIFNENQINSIHDDLKNYELKDDERIKQKQKLNQQVINILSENAFKRYKKAVLENDLKHDYRKNSTYLENSQKLIENLININAPNINEFIR